jgi:energy-coupling factor transporter ATP-binding protein EcfA2
MCEVRKPPIQSETEHLPLFTARNVSFTYPGGIRALAGVDLDIHSGERIALVGPNGSGKTTLIKQLCGLLRPATGYVNYKGEVLTDGHLDRFRLEIGVLFQDSDDQLFGHTVLEDAAFGPRQKGLSRDGAERAALRALRQVGLDGMAYKAPHNLSYGQKKRAALAGLLALKPEVLLLDEPTANQDPGQEEGFLDLLGDFPGTLICISHDLIFLYELCDRAVVLDRGRLRRTCTIGDLVSHRRSLREYGLDFSFRLYPASPPLHPAAPQSVPARPEHPGAPGSNPLVDLDGYSCRYPDGTAALKDVTLSIRDGERVALVGENGAGKTTLVSCLVGLLRGQGQYRFAGQPVVPRHRRALWRQTGIVFQDCADQLFCSTVREEIAFGLKQAGRSRREIEERIPKVLSMVSLEGFEDRVPLHLSGGERKRLALGCVLALEPKLLILDEPTAGLDPRGVELMLKILRELDVTLLLVSHDVFFIKELTNRAVVMHRGEILEDLPIDMFLHDERHGNLNGISFVYRHRSADAIGRLQHEHEHRHVHRHLHSHVHHHDGVEHRHFHEHEHDHLHRFVHSHGDEGGTHDHRPRRYHDHDHQGCEWEAHEHEHDHQEFLEDT